MRRGRLGDRAAAVGRDVCGEQDTSVAANAPEAVGQPTGLLAGPFIAPVRPEDSVGGQGERGSGYAVARVSVQSGDLGDGHVGRVARCFWVNCDPRCVCWRGAHSPAGDAPAQDYLPALPLSGRSGAQRNAETRNWFSSVVRTASLQ